MVLDSPELADLANLALRTLQYQVRQAVTTSASSAASSATTSADSTAAASSSLALTPTHGVDPATTSAATDTTSSGGGSSSQGSSPLLFFVALGFGVVFTNLWIIVGVKYCFRYNARNRNIRITGEDGEPINLENMPAHPRRRRREKKLMTMDEVNEKFPMMKYKSWVASRAQEGLPTRGGISQPPSRANSLRDADGIIPVNKERDSTEERPPTSGTSLTKQATQEPSIDHDDEKSASPINAEADARSPSGPAADLTAPPPTRTDSPASDDEHDDEDDQIHDALPPEMLESSGDTCAICIDTLEDDDDVRGLTCGHAFHAVCLDPWLTSRRACCPLCKADYYTPKPRPAPAEGTDGAQLGPTVSIAQDPRTNRAGNRMNMPSRPGVVWSLARGGGRLSFPSFGRNRTNEPDQSRTQRRGDRPRERQSRIGYFSQPATQTSRPSRRTTSGQNTQSNNGGFLSSLRQQLPRFGQSGATQNQSGTNAQVTPSALEAGTRTDGAR